MAQVAKRSADEVAIQRRKDAVDLQQDIKLSLAQSQSLPDMLRTAPLAINLLGHIKLLAFTDEALRIRLTEPRGGFKYLQRTSLSSAMIQIVDQSAEAFDMAEKKMRTIRMQTNVMFGRNGHVQTILMCLQDPRRAQKDLLVTMSKFEKDMEKCAEWAKEIEGEFDSLVKCASEVNLSMAEEMTIAGEEQEKIEGQEIKAEFAKEKQANVVSVLKSRVEDAQSEFVQAREKYQEASSKGEFSAMFTAAAVGLGGSFTGLINAAVSICKDAPKVAIETAKAVGRVGSIGYHRHDHHHGSNGDPASGQAGTSPNVHSTAPTSNEGLGGLDPALLSAEQIETQLLTLDELLNDELPGLLQEGGNEISTCAARFESLRKGLGDYRSKHTVDADAILDEALVITGAILSSRKSASHDNDKATAAEEKPTAANWEKKILRWSKGVKSLLNRATTLRSFAAAQPGQGFGGSGNPPQDPTSLLPGTDTTSYDKILHQRHQTLLIKRSAMNEARLHFEKQTEKQLAAQAEVIDIAHRMRELAHKKTTIEDTKRVLRQALDVMMAMQDQVRQLKGFFDALANIISIVGKGQAETYLATIRAGIEGNGGSSSNPFLLAHTEQQLQTIRETVITLRGHFGFVIHATDLYQEIATTHINPCIRMAATLPLGASPAQQEEAKRQLKLVTDQSSEAIKRIAQQEVEAYTRDLEIRVSEIEGEMAALGFESPEKGDSRGGEDDLNMKAIEEGIRASGEEIEGETKELGELFHEILDDM